MNPDRIRQLLNYLKEEPNDPFLKYAIATEYASTRPDIARSYFEDLLKNHSEYLPTYYHAAQIYADLEETEMTKDIYEKGIRLATDQEEMKTKEELERAYQSFLLEEDL